MNAKQSQERRTTDKYPKYFGKIVASQIQEHIQRIIHHNQIELIPRMQR
jgi:hypothetical protein